MKSIYTCLLTVIILFSACNRRSSENDLIVFDYYKSYPEIDLKLSDIADITYIPLKKGEQNYIHSGNDMWQDIYIDETANKVYFLTFHKIYVYDLQGNPLQLLNKKGRGPEEYLFMTNFWVEKENNAVYCYDGMAKTLVVYDTLFQFKRKIPFVIPPTSNIVRIKGDTLAIYNHPSLHDSKNKEKYRTVQERYPNIPPFFFTFAYNTAQVIQATPYHTERRIRDFVEGPEYLYYPAISRGINGLFMANKCCDTVLWMNTKTMEVRPRFIDITNYHTPECMAIPSFETEKFLFFDVHLAPKLSPNIKKKYFLYDKASKKIFQIKARAYEPLENTLGLLNNECALTSTISTKNYNYAATCIQPLFLLDNRDNLPQDLHAMVDMLNENDNPILMLIKLKK
ncbi:MAG: 6-bladed beta-propeller [Bacteroidales bacterium]